MRKLLLLLSIVIVPFLNSLAQDPSARDMQGQLQPKANTDTSLTWKKGGVISLNLAQGSSRNWAAGAEKFSFSIAAYVNLFANKRQGKFNWGNSLDLGYAFLKTTSLGSRKTDDKIDFFSKMGYDLSKTLSIAGVVNFRTQFNDGFQYNYLGKGLKRRTSGFLAPAYLIVAPGVDWHPNDYFSIFFSPLSARFIIVTNKPKSYYFQGGQIPDSVKGPGTGNFEIPLSVLYGVDPARQIRTEIGAFASINFNKEVLKNVIFKTRLDLYSNYLKTNRFTPTGPDQLSVTKIGSHPEKVDVYWTNLLVMKVNKFLNVTYNLDLIYDDDVRQFGSERSSAAAQLRTLLGVGFTAKF